MNDPQHARDGGNLRPPALLARPLLRLAVLGAVLLSMVLGLLGVQMYRIAWQDAWRSVHDTHRVIASDLATRVAAYVNEQRATVAALANGLGRHAEPVAPARRMLDGLTGQLPDIRYLTLLDSGGVPVAVGGSGSARSAAELGRRNVFLHVAASGNPYQAGVAASPFDQRPDVLLGAPVRDPQGKLSAVLVAEISVEPIEAMRRAIRIGEGGHALVVDQHGRVVAHPSPEWMREMRDLSGLKVVQTVLTGGSGVTEFFAPFAGETMVAGYAPVPGLGWGVIVPQPRSEIAAQVRRVLYGQFAWAGLALVALLLLGYLVAHWVTRPLQALAGRRRGGGGS